MNLPTRLCANNVTDKIMLAAYSGLITEVLVLPTLLRTLGGWEHHATRLDFNFLCRALIDLYSTGLPQSLNSARQLWLLAHYIDLYRNNRGIKQHLDVLRSLCWPLSSLASEILGRTDVIQASDIPSWLGPKPLPSYVQDQLSSLVDQSSISRLLAKFDAYVLSFECQQVKLTRPQQQRRDAWS